MREIELLAPAGNRECLETAFYFGADAAYLAGTNFGLRAFANNFTDAELEDAIRFAHSLGRKIYVTVNALLRNDEVERVAEYLRFLSGAGADGVIVSDPGVLKTVRDEKIDIDVHISTQASTTNYMAAGFWHEMGAKRVVLSREVSLEEIKSIRENTDNTLEIEAFVHGAMCIAHSGRCLLSSVLTGRSGNRGECAQPCRWEYYLHEKGYEGQYFEISEDERGTYILNSRDLMMIGHIGAVIEAGITSLKVEGRMKSAYYVASVVSAYRRAIDAYYAGAYTEALQKELAEELEKSATRGFTTGFYFGNPGGMAQDVDRTEKFRKYTFAAKALEAATDGRALVEQRNKFCVGDVLEVLSPNLPALSFEVKSIEDRAGQAQDAAPHPKQQLFINCPCKLEPGDMLRRLDG